MAQIYDATEVTTVVDGVNLFGFGDGDMVTCGKDEDNISVVEDAQGRASAAITNSNLGTITVTLAQTSPCYSHMVRLANNKRIFPVRVIHGSEVIGGTQAFVQKQPDTTFGKAVGTREFTIKVLDYTHSV